MSGTPKEKRMNRRRFLRGTAAGTAATILPATTGAAPLGVAHSGRLSLILPKKCNATRDQMERAGFIIGDDYDKYFVRITLPAGWYLGEKKMAYIKPDKPNGDLALLCLHDHLDRGRGQSDAHGLLLDNLTDDEEYWTPTMDFDYRLHIGMSPLGVDVQDEGGRYVGTTLSIRYDDYIEQVYIRQRDGQKIWVSDLVPAYSSGIDFRERQAFIKECRDKAKVYLDTYYPDWRNPLAYWD